tara:strand:- start:122 stop:295 length:174 start_codon:yes stop_codon:yes gene_type:complete
MKKTEKLIDLVKKVENSRNYIYRIRKRVLDIHRRKKILFSISFKTLSKTSGVENNHV